jgi:hypothetical protein
MSVSAGLGHLRREFSFASSRLPVKLLSSGPFGRGSSWRRLDRHMALPTMDRDQLEKLGPKRLSGLVALRV